MSADCCGYGCTQGQDFPARATPATMMTTCDDLGVCQHPAAPCSGACEHPVLNGNPWRTADTTPHNWDLLLTQLCMVVVYGLSAGVAIGIAGWLWELMP